MEKEAYNHVKGQAGPCGITCGTCVLGNGTIAITASKTKEHILGYGIKEWAPSTPGGKEINWVETEKALDWLIQNANCRGCENGGGQPECVIRNCANDKGYQLCNECNELDTCKKFDWLGDYSKTLKEILKNNKGVIKKDFIKKQLMEAQKTNQTDKISCYMCRQPVVEDNLFTVSWSENGKEESRVVCGSRCLRDWAKNHSENIKLELFDLESP